MLVDSHCHLDRLDLTPYDGDLSGAIAAAQQRGVDRMLCIGIDLDNAPTVIDIARRHSGVFASVGVHPLDLAGVAPAMEKLEILARDPAVVAIGETGLDYYYSSEQREVQRESFRQHIQLASRLDKPLIVHTRQAQDDTLEHLREAAALSARGVLHCFTESWVMAEQALALGFYISFSGIITFRNAEDLREVVRRTPLDRLLVETDSPYLAPVPFRGKKNEPQYVVEVARCVAELKGLSYEELAAITSANFEQLFLGENSSPKTDL